VQGPRRYRRDELISGGRVARPPRRRGVQRHAARGRDLSRIRGVAPARARALDGHGIGPRHLRPLRQSAERDVALVQSALSALLRAPTPRRARAPARWLPSWRPAWTRCARSWSRTASAGCCRNELIAHTLLPAGCRCRGSALF
jgi:hypothetical protein